MTVLGEFWKHPFIHCLGWALLHSLWQGAVVAAAFGLLRFALRRSSAGARYLAGCFALVLLLMAPIVTLFLGSLPPQSHTDRMSFSGASSPAPFFGSASQTLAAGSHRPAFFQLSTDLLEPIVPWFVALWSMGVGIFSIRLLHGFWWIRRIKTRQVEPLDTLWQERLADLKSRLKICRPVRLLKSALVQVPTVVGWLRPVILLPASSLIGLTPAQLEAIIAHELAHIGRHDYLVNAFQNVVEILMFYHPAAWWISRCIREEREHCCDDLVVRVCGDRVVYAQALATMEELRGAAPQLAFTASGGSLLNRVRRLLGLPMQSVQPGWREFAGLAFLGTGLVLVITGVCLMVAPVRYEATTRIQVEPDSSNNVSANSSPNQYDPYFFQTQEEIISSLPVLSRVIDTLHSNAVWADRYKSGDKLSTHPTLVFLLRKRLNVRWVKNTSLIEIRVRSEAPDESARIANAVAESYQAQRLEIHREASRGTLKALREQWTDLAREVNGAEDNVDRLRMELHISDPDPTGALSNPILTADALRQLQTTLISMETEQVRQEAQFDNLIKLKGNRIQSSIQIAIGPDAVLTSLLEAKNRAEQKVIELGLDFSPTHPTVQNARQLVDDLTAKVNERVDGILVGLQNRLDAGQAAINELKKKLDAAREADNRAAETNRPYHAAKQTLAELVQSKNALAIKIAQESTDLTLPMSSRVAVVETAVPPTEPTSPNRLQAATLIGLGVLLSILGLVTLRRRSV